MRFARMATDLAHPRGRYVVYFEIRPRCGCLPLSEPRRQFAAPSGAQPGYATETVPATA
jgi:hypothetical protein